MGVGWSDVPVRLALEYFALWDEVGFWLVSAWFRFGLVAYGANIESEDEAG